MIEETGYRKIDGIIVNRLDFRLDEMGFDRRYAILHTEYATYETRRTAVRLLSGFKTVRAVRYEYGGRSFYVLLEGHSERDGIIDTLNRFVLDEPVG